MPISRRSTIILVLAAFLIALIPKHTIAGNKASRIGKLHHKVAHHRGDRIGKLDCAFGEIAKFDGSEWICAPDDNSDTVGELSCSDGQVAKYDENSNEWACADVGDGPQPCPAGFVALNDKVCIEELDKGTSFTWFDANRSCVIDSNARLCTPGEWVAACQEEDIIISNSASRFEWTDDVADPGGFITVLQFVNCTHLAITRADSANATFRCCQDR